ncbi:DUF3196 family protein [Spiroplasma endosymbiont of Anurida maritima]|uniref:DUF3196 family protein n=1 Tax=Spiroplasma endosymbiont of Anurida maritima TaxID=2967972 RepID=UPI0036D30C55
MNNYYKEVIKEIEQLVNENSLEKALNLINEELNLPYVPSEVEEQLTDLFKLVHSKISEKSFKHNQWSVEDIKEILSSPFDEEIHLAAFYHLQNLNPFALEKEIKFYLESKLFKDDLKTNLLFALNKSNYDKELSVVKNHGIFKVNPKNINIFYDDSVYQNIEKMLEDIFLVDNASLYNASTILLQNYYYKMFPKIIKVEEKILFTSALVYKILLMFSLQEDFAEIKDKHFNNIGNIETNPFLEFFTREKVI